MAEIRISYPEGQLGPRPQAIKLNERCRVTCSQPGTVTIEFTQDSPFGAAIVHGNMDVVAKKPGKFKFKCTLTPPGGQPIVLGDANDPKSGPGGELEIGI